MRPLEASFLGSAADPAGFPPPGGPEIALAGRSNVGKSSAINTLAGRRGLAITSRTPGRTRLINFFALTIDPGQGRPPLHLRLVDLPGYGFARASKTERMEWARRVDAYLDHGAPLALVHLIDLRHDATPLDQELIRWADAKELPRITVATKADKLARNARLTRVRRLESALGTARGEVVVFSALSGEGREELLERLAKLATSSRPAPPAS